MTIENWLKSAVADAERRQLPDLAPMLETLARATRALRDADFVEPPTTRRLDDGRRDDGRDHDR